MSAYANAAQLYSDIEQYMDRHEASIVNRIPMWVHMAEDELDRRLRHPAAEEVQNYEVKAGFDFIPAPRNLLELKSLRLEGVSVPLTRRSLETLYDVPSWESHPVAFASRANYYILDKKVKEDTNVEFIYWTTPEKLSNTNSSNLYLVAAADFLLYAALSSAFSYDTNPEESQYYRGLAETALSNIQSQISREAMSGHTLVCWSDTTSLSTYF